VNPVAEEAQLGIELGLECTVLILPWCAVCHARGIQTRASMRPQDLKIEIETRTERANSMQGGGAYRQTGLASLLSLRVVEASN
jgi:hypothetical protein